MTWGRRVGYKSVRPSATGEFGPKWGPDFGESSDDNTFTVAVAAAFTDLALESAANIVRPDITLTDLVAVFNTMTVNQTFDQGGGHVYDAAVDFGALGPGGFAAGKVPAQLNTATNPGSLGADYGSIRNAIERIVDDPQWCIGGQPGTNLTGLGPTKDVTVIAESAVNQNTLTTLAVIAATPPATPESDAWIFFPFNTAGIDLDNHVTVLTAMLRLTPTVVQVGAVTIQIHKIADADEGWIEGSLAGTGAPATTGQLMTFNVANAATDVQVTLNATTMLEMQRKINANVQGMTFVLKMQTNAGVSTFNSREAVTNNGPFLGFCITTPISGAFSGGFIALEDGSGFLLKEDGDHILIE